MNQKMKKLIEDFISTNQDSIKITTNGFLLERSILNYFGEKNTLNGIISFFKKIGREDIELPVNISFLGDKVWNLRMTEEKVRWDCPNGTHYVYDGEILNPVCELTHRRGQTIKLKKE